MNSLTDNRGILLPLDEKLVSLLNIRDQFVSKYIELFPGNQDDLDDLEFTQIILAVAISNHVVSISTSRGAIEGIASVISNRGLAPSDGFNAGDTVLILDIDDVFDIVPSPFGRFLKQAGYSIEIETDGDSYETASD